MARGRKRKPWPAWAKGIANTADAPVDHSARLAGHLATWDGTCPRCDQPIVSRQSQVVRRHEVWIHAQCHPGFDDE